MELVCAEYDIYSTMYFKSDSATLRVYSDGTSEMELHFYYPTYGADFVYEMPDGAIIRLIRANYVDGYFGEAPVITDADHGGKKNHFSAVVPIDRALAEGRYLKFALCKADGTEIRQLRYELKSFTSESGAWPEPESTPPVATIPPVRPTPSPTPRATLAPDATEPPQDTALYAVTYNADEHPASLTSRSATLRVYPSDVSVLTLEFDYDGELPEGAVMCITAAKDVAGDFGKVPLVPLANGSYQAQFFFNQRVGQLDYFITTVCMPDGETRLFRVNYRLQSQEPEGWWDNKLPAPAGQTSATVSGDPARTEPPYSTALVKYTYNLRGKVNQYSHYNATLRQYADCTTLNVFFFYREELPEGAYMRLVSADAATGDYGSAVIGPANVEGTDAALLNAKIFTTAPAASYLTVECCSPEGEVLFTLDFHVKEVSSSTGNGGSSLALQTSSPGSPGSPASTPSSFPLKDAIEDGMQIKPPSSGGFTW